MGWMFSGVEKCYEKYSNINSLEVMHFGARRCARREPGLTDAPDLSEHRVFRRRNLVKFPVSPQLKSVKHVHICECGHCPRRVRAPPRRKQT